MLLLGQRARAFFQRVALNAAVDYPLVMARDEGEMGDVIRLCENDRMYVASTIQLAGWTRIDALRKMQPDSRMAFVAMSFAEDLLAAYDNGIRPGIEQTQYFTAYRLDRVQHNDKIDDRILADIRRAGLVVADFTHNRGSVYFEAGYALGLGIPVVWTCRKQDFDQIQFDTRQYPYIVWETPEELHQRLNDRIAATVLPRPSGATHP